MPGMHALPLPHLSDPDPDAEPDDSENSDHETQTGPDIEPANQFIPLTAPLVRADLSKRGPIGRVVAEWSRLCRRPDALDHVNSWTFIDPPVSHLDEVLVRSGFGGATTDSVGDRVLWHLADLSRTDELAARIVLHRILPALMSIARRRGRIHPQGPYAAMEELLTTAWSVIRTYPSERRPRKVAANLVRDCEYHAFVRPQRLRRAEEVPFEQMGAIAATPQDPEPADELAEVLTDALAAGVNGRDIALLRALADGRSSTEIALELGVSPRTVRNWRLRAIKAVRDTLE